jgi:hypothetical protein
VKAAVFRDQHNGDRALRLPSNHVSVELDHILFISFGVLTRVSNHKAINSYFAVHCGALRYQFDPGLGAQVTKRGIPAIRARSERSSRNIPAP